MAPSKIIWTLRSAWERKIGSGLGQSITKLGTGLIPLSNMSVRCYRWRFCCGHYLPAQSVDLKRPEETSVSDPVQNSIINKSYYTACRVTLDHPPIVPC